MRSWASSAASGTGSVTSTSFHVREDEGEKDEEDEQDKEEDDEDDDREKDAFGGTKASDRVKWFSRWTARMALAVESGSWSRRDT